MLTVGEDYLKPLYVRLHHLLDMETPYGDDGQIMLREVISLVSPYRDWMIVERLRQWVENHPEHAGKYGVEVAISLIDPQTAALQEHGFDELIFGGFICTACTPENCDDPDDNVMWPCPPLRAMGLTDQMAIDHIKAQRARWAKEREERNHGQA